MSLISDDLQTLLGQLQTAQLSTNITSSSQITETLDLLTIVLDTVSKCRNNSFLTLSLAEAQSEVTATLKQASSFLSNSLKSILKGNTKEDGDVELDALVEKISELTSIIARMSGDAETKDGEGATISWVYGKDLLVTIKELSFQEASFGWQTWSGGALFAYLISIGKIPVKNETILELGCGTGIVGIMACKMGAKHVYMTDYHHRVLESTIQNIKSNNCESSASAHSLDWTWIAEGSPIQHTANKVVEPFDISEERIKFDVILGADICYDPIHGKLVPPVCERFISDSPNAKVYFVTGLRREKFAHDISFFENQMEVFGFRLDYSEDVSMDQFLESSVQLKSDLLEKRMMEGLAKSIFKGADPRFRFYVCLSSQVNDTTPCLYQVKNEILIVKKAEESRTMYEEFEDLFDKVTTAFFDASVKQESDRVVSALADLQLLLRIVQTSRADTSALSVADPNHLSILEKQGSQWLNTLQNYWSLKPQDELINRLLNQVSEMKSMLRSISLPTNASTSALTSSSVTKTWTFTESITVELQEQSFEECAYGWQTWSGGQLLAYLIASNQLDSVFKNLPTSSNVLELGCGTGIVGITTAKVIESLRPDMKLVMTDYLDTILHNAQNNVLRNCCSNQVSVQKLDWRNIEPSLPHFNQKFNLIVAADVCYEIEHGKLVPPVCNQLLSHDSSARIIFLSTLRGDQFGIQFFESRMMECGFVVESVGDITKESLMSRHQGANGFLDGVIASVFNGPDQEFRLCVFSRG